MQTGVNLSHFHGVFTPNSGLHIDCPESNRMYVLVTSCKYLHVSSTAGSFLPTVTLTYMRLLMQLLINKAPGVPGAGWFVVGLLLYRRAVEEGLEIKDLLTRQRNAPHPTREVTKVRHQ